MTSSFLSEFPTTSWGSRTAVTGSVDADYDAFEAMMGIDPDAYFSLFLGFDFNTRFSNQRDY